MVNWLQPGGLKFLILESWFFVSDSSHGVGQVLVSNVTVLLLGVEKTSTD